MKLQENECDAVVFQLRVLPGGKFDIIFHPKWEYMILTTATIAVNGAKISFRIHHPHRHSVVHTFPVPLVIFEN